MKQQLDSQKCRTISRCRQPDKHFIELLAGRHRQRPAREAIKQRLLRRSFSMALAFINMHLLRPSTLFLQFLRQKRFVCLESGGADRCDATKELCKFLGKTTVFCTLLAQFNPLSYCQHTCYGLSTLFFHMTRGPRSSTSFFLRQTG